jgi:hypothetical protein
MLTSVEIERHFDRLTYKDGWRFLLYVTPWEGPFVRIEVDVEDSYNPGETTTLGVNSFLPPMESTDQLESWLMARIIRIESHEAREFFKRDGEVIFDPHAEGEPYFM